MNRHVSAYCSIILRKAPWASAVNASASSRKMTLKSAPNGLVLANCLTLVRMLSSFRSSLAFISKRLSLDFSPKTSRQSAKAAVVFLSQGVLQTEGEETFQFPHKPPTARRLQPAHGYPEPSWADASQPTSSTSESNPVFLGRQ